MWSLFHIIAFVAVQRFYGTNGMPPLLPKEIGDVNVDDFLKFTIGRPKRSQRSLLVGFITRTGARATVEGTALCHREHTLEPCDDNGMAMIPIAQVDAIHDPDVLFQSFRPITAHNYTPALAVIFASPNCRISKVARFTLTIQCPLEPAEQSVDSSTPGELATRSGGSRKIMDRIRQRMRKTHSHFKLRRLVFIHPASNGDHKLYVPIYRFEVEERDILDSHPVDVTYMELPHVDKSYLLTYSDTEWSQVDLYDSKKSATDDVTVVHIRERPPLNVYYDSSMFSHGSAVNLALKRSDHLVWRVVDYMETIFLCMYPNDDSRKPPKEALCLREAVADEFYGPKTDKKPRTVARFRLWREEQQQIKEMNNDPENFVFKSWKIPYAATVPTANQMLPFTFTPQWVQPLYKVTTADSGNDRGTPYII